ncbi:thiosulfate dehydrogenase [quinone] large subunit [Mariniphaga anaerophila]|uniref:Thiosulfate dehydrogenase [quinone] large subunit n=1 Tax=Mariniphaga anaerophila TaxID=1484053 RepID=A0A1M5EGV9_9BACT|nr:TQO small subunit DoxD [Mariniphaga anaerophila]SHF78485.1 thiosulfate dehydrogenase [quinone] large subunit [Mariniphaga anaerophila]
MKNNSKIYSTEMAGLFSLSIRLVVGWTYFSAFWRRVVLANKLDPEIAGYIGEKFNHFLPNALGIKPIIEYLVTNPDMLWLSMVIFTVIEAIVGLFVMLGLFTRLMGIGVFSLAMGILLGSGWIGTTCLDEWQIGVLGVASGFALFLSGSSSYSFDQYFINKNFGFTRQTWFRWLGSGSFPIKNPKRLALTGSLAILFLTLFTNQYFHGGIFGTLHNKSVKPKIEISNTSIADNSLHFEIYRTEGVDVYGSFLIGIQVLDEKGNIIIKKDGTDLSKLSTSNINNHYVANVKPGKHSLIVPLGAKADLTIDMDNIALDEKKQYTLKLIDISGIEWEVPINTFQQ